MKTLKTIAISFLLLSQVSLIIFVKIKASDAEMSRIEAEDARDEAMQLQQRTLNEAAKARMAEAHALNLSEQLKKCQSQ